MKFSQRLELGAGVLTGVLGLLPPVFKHGAHMVDLFRMWPSLLVDAILLFLVPGVLVTIGSILHAVRGKTSGLVLLLVGGIFLMLMTLVYVFGGAIFYVFGVSGGIVVLSQALIAVLTVISSLVVVRKRVEKKRP